MTTTHSRARAIALACLFLASGVEAATTAQTAAALGCDPDAP